MPKPRVANAVRVCATLTLIGWVIFVLINTLLFKWAFVTSLVWAFLMVNGCFLLSLFVVWAWPKLMWSGAWLHWWKYSRKWEEAAEENQREWMRNK